MGALDSDARHSWGNLEVDLAGIARYERMDDRSNARTGAIDHGNSVRVARKEE
jgi:hypothetical protein